MHVGDIACIPAKIREVTIVLFISCSGRLDSLDQFFRCLARWIRLVLEEWEMMLGG